MKILVVEDDELIAEFLVRSLRIDKHQVLLAKDGQEGYHQAMTGFHDAIMLDVVLPRKNGLEICRALRQKGNSTPILFLSARDTEAARVEGLDAGADDYLVKPFSYKELQARLRAITRRSSIVLQTKLQVGDVTLDSAKHVVTRGNRMLHLRPKEFTLLEYFMRNPGVVLSRQQILKDVWGISPENSSNRLEVYIRHLRSKLTVRSEKQLIKTIRGKGYTIKNPL